MLFNSLLTRQVPTRRPSVQIKEGLTAFCQGRGASFRTVQEVAHLARHEWFIRQPDVRECISSAVEPPSTAFAWTLRIGHRCEPSSPVWEISTRAPDE